MRCRRLSWSQGTRLWLPGLWTGSFSGGTQQLYGAFVPRAPVAMVTQKPLRRVLCTRPASTPSGVGTCHHGNRFPHLTKGPPNRPWAGAEGLGSEGRGGTHLGQAGSKEHTFEELSHSLQELVHVWPLQHVHLQRQGHQAGQSQQPPGKAWGPESPGEEGSLTRPLPPDPRRAERGAVLSNMALRTRQPSRCAPGLSLKQTPRPRRRGKLTWCGGICRTSEWKGWATFG